MNEYQVMASNDLRSGRVVYLTAYGWSDDFHAAARLESDTALDAAQRQALDAIQSNEVIDPYLVKVVAEGRQPAHIREQIRRSGPTCLPLDVQRPSNQIAG